METIYRFDFPAVYMLQEVDLGYLVTEAKNLPFLKKDLEEVLYEINCVIDEHPIRSLWEREQS